MTKNEFDNGIDEIFELKDTALKLMAGGNNLAATDKIKEAAIRSKILLNRAPSNDNLFDLHFLLGFFYRELELAADAKLHAEKAVGLNPKSELASLLLYLLYVDLDETEKAISEVQRFIKTGSEIQSYRVTIGELLQDARKGFLPKYVKLINSWAEKFKVV